MTESFKVIPFLIFHKFALITGSLHGDAPESVSNFLNGTDNGKMTNKAVFG